MPSYNDIRTRLGDSCNLTLLPSVRPSTSLDGPVTIEYNWKEPVELPDPVTVPKWLIDHLADFGKMQILYNKNGQINKVGLIKIIREVLGCGLKEAKDILDLVIIPLI